ncbi:effector binding domain-containing protein [Paenibacillus sp.]|uniref:GyrI-like domain-containing protein n=1 Tax=Paenibacillus sp. TaxID=58172 RepID=UPI0028119AC0|nr:GyrI-like domain-containing protein [Paenibacillus sp.]
MKTEQNEMMERNELKLVGFSIVESLNQVMETMSVGKLRMELANRMEEIENRIGTGMYLLQIYPQDGHWTPDVPYRHVIGCDVAAFGDIPDEMTTYTVLRGRYVKIVHQGPESQLAATYDYINKTYGVRPIDIEYWDDLDALESESGRIELFIPANR